MRNDPEQLTASLILGTLNPLRQSSDLRLYGRMFDESHADADGEDFWQLFNPDSLKVIKDLSQADNQPCQGFQFERFGHLITNHLELLATSQTEIWLSDGN